MPGENKKRLLSFIIGVMIVSLVTVLGTLAFFEKVKLYVFLRNIVVTDLAYIGLYVVWIKLHKNYERMYKFSMKEEK